MNTLLSQIKACSVCKDFICPNPILSISKQCKIIIIGQAPGRIVHETGIPWNDKSGDNLRAWLQIDKTTFYNNQLIGIMPMGFCYPGTGKNGDLPPRPECAELWHQKALNHMKKVKLILLIGKYAQDYYLRDRRKETLTDTVRSYSLYLPKYFTLPHPSPRNNIWVKKNKWFEKEVLPELRNTVSKILNTK